MTSTERASRTIRPARLVAGAFLVVAAVAACGGSGTGGANASASAGAGGGLSTPPLTGGSPEASMEASPSMAASPESSAGASESASPEASTGALASPSESMGASASGGLSGAAGASASPGAMASPGGRTVEVYAAEGSFQNAPVDPVPGTILTFRNVGQQAHEMVVLRRNDSAAKDQTFDNLAKLDPAKLMKFVTVVGVLAADPGQQATGQIVLDQPGDYAIVDLLAQGTTTAPASPDPMALPSGVPNVATGMFVTFTVAAPSAS